MNDKLRPNEVQLFGQRFHACVAVFYLGLGLFLGNAVHRWFADAALWLPLIGHGKTPCAVRLPAARLLKHPRRSRRHAQAVIASAKRTILNDD